MSVYQASENLYDIFDKVQCVICDGQIVYNGPASLARQYSIDMGYELANRQTILDFLIAVTDPNARVAREGYESRVPRTADEFTEYYLKSNVWQINQEDMDTHLNDSVGKPQSALAYRESAWAEHPTAPIKQSSHVTDPDANEGGHGQEVTDPQGQPGNSDYQRRGIHDSGCHDRNRVLACSEHDDDFLLEGWCSLLVCPFPRNGVVSPDSLTLSSAILFAGPEFHG